MAPIKVGLVGYGSSVKIFHLPFILPNPDLEVHAFLQRAEAPEDKSKVESGKHCTVDHPNVQHYRTAKAFFGDGDIELVIVCTGHDTHAELAEQALQAGKHVVVEKPFTITSAEADNLIAVAKKQNKILTCYQNRRYDSDFRTVQNYIRQGIFGRITEFANHYDVDNPPWIHSDREPRPGDGLLYGLGSHSIDQTLQLFGLPKSVTAFSRTLLTKSDDSFTIVLQYSGGHKDLISTIKTTVVAPIGQHLALKFWVRGTKGVFIKNGEDMQIEHLLENGLKPTDPTFGVEPERYHGYLTTRKDIDEKFEKPSSQTSVKFDRKVPSKQGSYLDYYKDVVAAIRGEREVAVKPEQSRNVIRVIELANESIEKGVTVAWS
ncbi:hypothetical protein CLAFUW4_03903 [Fulvia fulva]|uniref:Uncharacterized protein n=1 Tax=Passalora fulva TaxID=5499 RepID=A0A9Q8LA16_PASFU|nr:uncharacterized protein CLAFUR5_03873 [Fulvia fulva]KAK4632203.1 hypothetical protein CLAFUR4_03891 [Fulvia fulva]KAK4633621.1 hypothetical protein CLAFUR0_03890 [Fulvia fulva]UJO13597.1 hypothetical protein CLAFUR5_03873 [Fulvia fulva]WPV11167.1 hypothetical protein CLAFUW4_03903 [Fulvia fulva]WPV26514.1 hypothetical protein CLAFUW7_03894 [Fulvia fulva]